MSGATPIGWKSVKFDKFVELDDLMSRGKFNFDHTVSFGTSTWYGM
jgi:hypothetical protein